jgi:hypothetical protein
MEQVTSLINRLEEQVKQGASATSILAITALLRHELEGQLSECQPTQRDSVAVWLPAGYRAISVPQNKPAESHITPEALEKPVAEPVKVETTPAETLYVPKPPMVPVPPQVVIARESLMPAATFQDERGTPQVLDHEVEEERAVPVISKKPEPAVAPRPFPQYPDVASLMKNIFPVAPDPKPAPKEVNELVVDPVIALNEKLQEKKVELADVLATTGPKIGDIRKAITINEKYQMINSLFRNDEDMFERSVRTLNNFGSLPEARFWMQRELVVILGWNEQDELVQHFYKLVSRRFS